MKHKRSIFYFLLVVGLILNLNLIPAAADDLISRPGEYSGYSEVLYDEWVRSSQYVEAQDGTKLAVDIYRPAVDGVAVDTPYPALFNFTPYRRAYYAGGSLRLSDQGMSALTKYGYVIIVADVRGKGASYGTRVSMAHISEGWDAHDIIEWAAAQEWCSGVVGMFGGSANGHTMLAAAATAPPSLKAIYPRITEFDLYDGWMRGGMHRTTGGGGEGQDDLATAPVDEDTEDENGNGIPDMLEEAVSQHPDNTPYLPMLAELPYRDSTSTTYPEVGQFWLESSFSQYIDVINESDIAIYHSCGWNDLFTRDPIMGFINGPENRVKLVMGPGGHFGGGSGGLDELVEQHRFFDYWLKGIDNGIMDEPPIYYYTMGGPAGQEWRFAWQWPLPNEKKIKFYLQAGPSGSDPVSAYDGSLSTKRPKTMTGQDDYTADYSVTCNQLMGNCVYDQWGLTYTTDPLPEDVELTGHPVLHLWISSPVEDGDFFADLEEVDENGNAKYVAVQGRLRASHRSLNTPYYDFLGLPWHRSFEEDLEPLPIGEPVELTFDILPTSNVFEAGHRIRLTINCASKQVLSFLQFDPPPVVSIYRNKIHKSYISLPITTDPLKVRVDVKPGIFNLKSKGLFTVFITPPKHLPRGYRAEDIDISTVTCGGAPAVWGKVVKNTLIAKFDRKDLTDVPTGHKARLSVQGEFNYEIPFEGSDTIRVIRWGKE
ncbi:MAG: CocE/NonD family hydrolase [Deltaproteobacteria bacterium]|nr:CocE/NonD family hydrolase [Deltaproteobacteria bacterium]